MRYHLVSKGDLLESVNESLPSGSRPGRDALHGRDPGRAPRSAARPTKGVDWDRIERDLGLVPLQTHLCNSREVAAGQAAGGVQDA